MMPVHAPKLRALVAMAMACSGWQDNPTHHYHLEIAAGFSDAQSAAIVDAATEWERSSGDYVTFDGAWVTGAIISFHPQTAQQISAEFGGCIGVTIYQGQSSRVDLLTSLDTETFHQTALHEIGHAIGLAHLTPGNIMCANPTCATLQVTCGDLKQLVHADVTGCIP